MSRVFDSASSQYCEHAAAVRNTAPLTIAAWFKAGAGVTGTLCSIGATGAANHFFALALASSFVMAETRDKLVFTSTTYTASTWQHACAVFASASNRSVYLNGGGKQTNTDSATPSGLNRTSAGRTTTASPYQYLTGSVAEMAIWSTALSDADVTELQTKSPLLVQTGSLLAYWPFVRDDVDVEDSYDMTAYNAPTFGDHPDVIGPGPSMSALSLVGATQAADPTGTGTVTMAMGQLVTALDLKSNALAVSGVATVSPSTLSLAGSTLASDMLVRTSTGPRLHSAAILVPGVIGAGELVPDVAGTGVLVPRLTEAREL